MGFVDTAKTKLFGDQNNRGDHGFRAGFVPTIVPSLVVAGAGALGGAVAAGVVCLAVLIPAAVRSASIATGVRGADGVSAVFIGATSFMAGFLAKAATGTSGFFAGTHGLLFSTVTGVVAMVVATIPAKKAEEDGYNFMRYFSGEGAGGALGAALVFNVAAAHLLPEQPKAPVEGPVPSTLEIKPSGGSLCEDFKIADSEMTDKQGRKVYTLFVPQDCSLVPNP